MTVELQGIKRLKTLSGLPCSSYIMFILSGRSQLRVISGSHESNCNVSALPAGRFYSGSLSLAVFDSAEEQFRQHIGAATLEWIVRIVRIVRIVGFIGFIGFVRCSGQQWFIKFIGFVR